MTEQALFILASLAMGELHGYGIAQDAEALSEGRVRLTAGTLYGALNRLADDGLVTQSREDVVDGRRRRYYRLTAAGKAALAEETARMQSIASALQTSAPPGSRGWHEGAMAGLVPARLPEGHRANATVTTCSTWPLSSASGPAYVGRRCRCSAAGCSSGPAAYAAGRCWWRAQRWPRCSSPVALRSRTCRSRSRWRRSRPSPIRRQRRSIGSSTAPSPGTPAAPWSRCAAAASCPARASASPTTPLGSPASCDTVYDIGSLTKQFTAAAVVKLEMLGRLDVHDPISDWLGPVPADKAAITVQQLLTHTSGLVDTLGDDYQRLTRRQLVARALASPLRTAPGTAYHYSNVGYSLLAVIIERASGTSYERFLARQLFRPAHMTQTGYTLPDWQRSDVAVEYDALGRPQGRPFDHPWAADGPWWNLRGNGGILSTARDLARWHRALLDHRVLDRRAQRELFRPRVPEQPSGQSWYGYGWVLLDTAVGPVAWHNGGNGWSYAELTRVLGRGVMVFWVTNQVRSAGRLEPRAPRHPPHLWRRPPARRCRRWG